MSKPQNQAVFVNKPPQSWDVQDVPYPTPASNEIVVKTTALAICPLDWKTQDLFPDMCPTIMGFDMAGEVVEVGSNVTLHKVGDHVYAMATAKGGLGKAFQNYVSLRDNMAMQKPEQWADTDAAVVPSSACTAAYGLYHPDLAGLELPSLERKPREGVVIVWSGSSSVGSNAIQMAHASGYEVIATASTRNFDALTKLGASKLFDYKEEGVADHLLEYLKGKKVAGTFDAFGGLNADSTLVKVVNQAEGSKIIATVLPSAELGSASAQAKFIAAMEILEDRTLKEKVLQNYMAEATKTGKYVAAPPPEVVGHGFKDLQHALDVQKQGVSFKKVVITM